jgi:hypothetical protein
MRRLLLALLLAAALPGAPAMEFQRVEDTLILSGPVVGNDLARLKDHLAAGGVKLVLLHQSGGGDLWNGYQLAHRIREEGLPTAVSGKCESACGLMFLGGVERSFSDGAPLPQTMVGLHGAHDPVTRDKQSQHSPRMAYLIQSLSGGKFPPDLLQRTVYPNHADDTTYFFHPLRFAPRLRPRGVMECQRQPDLQIKCTMVEGLDAIAAGVVTNPAILPLGEAVKAALPPR